MSGEWKARRFWTDAQVRQNGPDWEVMLDDRVLRTPGKQALLLPTRALAEAIAAEWQAQTDVIDPLSMPLTRAANSAIERVAPQASDVAAMLAEYGATDLLSYRAEAPEDLQRAQADGWDPLIDWAAAALNAPLRVTHGIVPVPQDDAALLNLRAKIDALDIFGLTALHDLVTIPGSLILGLAVIDGRIDAQTAHQLSRIDEEFQAQRWGRDSDADAAAQRRLEALGHAEQLWRLSRIS